MRNIQQSVAKAAAATGLLWLAGDGLWSLLSGIANATDLELERGILPLVLTSLAKMILGISGTLIFYSER